MEGFKDTVKTRIYSFCGNILVSKLSFNNSIEEQPFNFNIPLYNNPKQFGDITHIQEFSHKAGLIKGEEDVLGIIIKGVGKSFDQINFNKNLIEGNFIHFSDSSYSKEIVVSRSIANKINLSVGDDIIIHFFQDPPRFRKLKVVGIYETNLSEYFDKKIIIGDIKLIQRLNNWPDSLAGGLEVFINKTQNTDEVYNEIGKKLDYDLIVEKVSDRYIQVFDWLSLVGRQVRVLLFIILTVVCMNMISVILILVMERTQMIGLLKALGATNKLIRWVFVYQSLSLVRRGLLYGNILGLGLCYLQYRFKIIKLNPHDYYMSYVPVQWDWWAVILLNLLIFSVTVFTLLLPTAIVSKISPIKAIKFD